jgi:hypothetical protein
VALVVLVGGVAAWDELREDRANRLAVAYGAAPSKGSATLADRCTGVMRREYDITGTAATATIGPKMFASIAPKVCALGVERRLVADDGTMSEQSGYDLMTAVIEKMGTSRFQTLVFNELAVSEYHLAQPAKITRWHRCVAMGYSAFDARPEKAGLPPRDLMRRAVRDVCTVGIRRGIVPPSGAPDAANPEFQQLLLTALVELQRP